MKNREYSAKRRVVRILWALGAMGLLLPCSVPASAMRSEIVRAPASRATYVTSGAPWQEYSAQERMVVGFIPNPALMQARGWVEFDLSALPADAVVEAAALGMARHGDDGPINPRELLVIDQGRPASLPGARVTWDRIGGGGNTAGPVVAVLSPGLAGPMRDLTPLTTLPELKTAIEQALRRDPRRLYLLLHSPEAEAQTERGHYWRLGAAGDFRPILMLQYASASTGEP